MLVSYHPPASEQVIRKLRLKHTLVRKQGGGWAIDLTKKGAHKTSKV